MVVGSCFSMVTHVLWTKKLMKLHIEGVKNMECYARIRTVNDAKHGNASNYSHLADEAQYCVLKVLDTMKNKFKHSEEATSIMINNTTRLPLVSGALPKKEMLGRMIRRARNTNMEGDLTTRGENFHLYESSAVIILSNEKEFGTFIQKSKHGLATAHLTLHL